MQIRAKSLVMLSLHLYKMTIKFLKLHQSACINCLIRVFVEVLISGLNKRK